jgi:branched-chain amino acid transport system permease protein
MSGWLVFIVSLLSLAGIYAILAMILNLEAGWGGLWDLGTAGLLAVGAYFYVLATVEADDVIFAPGWPMWAGILGSSLFTGLVALLIGLPALRLRGEYFLITTFAFAEVIRQIVTNQASLTRGARGFNQIERPFDQQVSADAYNFVLFGIVVAGVVVTYLIMRRVGRAPVGRALRALRDNEGAALALGKDVARYRAQTFVLAGLLIGAVAPVYVWYIRSISPHLFTPDITFTAWTALVIGGIGSFRGPVLGALLLILMTQATQFLQVAPEHAALLASLQPVIIGLALILILRFRPEGLIAERRDFARAARPRGTSEPEPGRPAPQEAVS